MEKYFLNDNIKLLCVNASSFPEGIIDAQQRLHHSLPSISNRKFFGISFPQNGKIIYKAAVEESYQGEGEKLQLESFVIKRGQYKGARIINFEDHIESIGKTFQKILTDPKIDPQGCCVEMYLNEKDVQCMVRLKSQ